MRSDPYTKEGVYYPDPLPVAVLVRRERQGRRLNAALEPLRGFSRRHGLIIPLPAG